VLFHLDSPISILQSAVDYVVAVDISRTRLISIYSMVLMQRTDHTHMASSVVKTLPLLLAQLAYCLTLQLLVALSSAVTVSSGISTILRSKSLLVDNGHVTTPTDR